MYPFKLKPIYDKTIWANDKLTTIRGVEEKGYGTSWEVSAHAYSTNEIMNGEYANQTLMNIIEKHPNEILGDIKIEQMLRLAFLDAKDDLSIQVHPNTDYAKKYENDLGKVESWYVLEAEPNATLVAGTLCNDSEIIRKAVLNGTLEKYLRKVSINAGDFIFIDAGMLHALGGGILAIEVGTNSNTTYRFYDYNRKDANGNGRELHIDKSFDVVDLTKQSEKVASPLKDLTQNESKVLHDCEEFCVELHDIVKEEIFDTKGKRFHTLCFVHNDAIVEYNGMEIKMNYTQSMFVPASCGKYKIIGNCRVLVSYVK